ncbi:MAG: iron-sulfur cluster-binding protein [Clostridiaceae bacterium BRH_c20a]|nr:MAG: iron-sulfur cluster-binding protein [Clostridiaceae bacterium BRH_c20a]
MLDVQSIYIIHGEDAKRMVIESLEKLELFKELSPTMRIGIKPNIVLEKHSSSGATTSVDLIDGVVEYLKMKGFNNITILESSGIGHNTQLAYKVTGLDKVALKHNIELIDLKGQPTVTLSYKDFNVQVFKKVQEIDYLINMPVVKAHCQTNITCALKNLKGLIPDNEKRRFHRDRLHRPIAYLNKIINTDLIIADGIMGDLTFEEGGNPVRMDRVLIAKDPVLIDRFVAESIGYDPKEVAHVDISATLGVGKSKIDKAKIVELNAPVKKQELYKRSYLIESLAKKIREREACSICYGSLIFALKRLKDNGKIIKNTDYIYIGQGYKDFVGEGVGVGNCTKGFSKFLQGCPPNANSIVEFLEQNL